MLPTPRPPPTRISGWRTRTASSRSRGWRRRTRARCRGYDEAFAIAAAKDRIPAPELTNGRVLNFWRDQEHPHGLWRWTTEADYANPSPRWTTLIDLDALGHAEGKTWVWKGSTCLQPEERLCLVALSEGGEDAVTYREFDLVAGKFVDGGFTLPKSKQDASWVDKDTLLVSRDWGAGTLTQSGYPFVSFCIPA